MRIYILFILSFFCVMGVANAQQSIITQINTPTLQRYIDLAKQNYPRKKMLEENIVAAKSKITTAGMGYLEALNVSYIYRPDNRQSINFDNPYSINGFQFGVNLNLGTFLKTPSLVKQSKQAYKVAVLEDKEYELTLTREVKARYYEYLRALDDLKVKSQAFADAKSTSDNLKYKFEKGETTLQAYTGAKASTALANSDQLIAETNLLRAKDALEELIGVKLEEAK